MRHPGPAAITLLLMALACPCVSFGAQPFSFAVLGDTRTEHYLPGGRSQAEEIKAVLKIWYKGRPVRLFFDEDGLELVRAEVSQADGSIKTTHYRNGWPNFITISASGRTRVIMRAAGRKWVMDRIVSGVRKGAEDPARGPIFVVHGGDIPVFGCQGRILEENPYYQLFVKELLSRLPPAEPSSGLPGRLFAAVGNHELLCDE